VVRIRARWFANAPHSDKTRRTTQNAAVDEHDGEVSRKEDRGRPWFKEGRNGKRPTALPRPFVGSHLACPLRREVAFG
jgi:hypothetical protein